MIPYDQVSFRMNFHVNILEYYISPPIKGFDDCFSDFRGCEIFEVPVLRIFGSTSAGKKGCIHVHGVFPYFSVRWKDVFPDIEASASRRYTQELAWEIDKALNVSARKSSSFRHHVFNVVPFKGLPFYGYHAEKEDFIRIYFYKPHDVLRTADIMTNGGIMNKFIQPYQAHIPYLSQFMMDYNIHRTLEISKFKLRASHAASDSKGSTKTVKPLDNAELVGNSWIVSTNSSVGSSIDVATYSGLELDCCKADILNAQKQTSQVGSNPGLLALWKEERMRRKMHDPEAEITQAVSQGTRNVATTDQESQYMRNLMRKILKTPTLMSANQQSPSEALDDIERLPDNDSQYSLLPSSQSSSFNQMVELMQDLHARCEDDSILGTRRVDDTSSDDDDDITREMSQRFNDELPEGLELSGDLALPCCDNTETPPVVEEKIVQLDGVYDDEVYEKFDAGKNSPSQMNVSIIQRIAFQGARWKGPVLSKEEKQVYPANQNELTDFNEEPPVLEPEQPLTSHACYMKEFSLRPCYVRVEKHPLLKLLDPSKPIPLSMLAQMNYFPASLVRFRRTSPPETSVKKFKASNHHQNLLSRNFKHRLKSRRSRGQSSEKRGLSAAVQESVSDLISRVENSVVNMGGASNSANCELGSSVPTVDIPVEKSCPESRSKTSESMGWQVTDLEFEATLKAIKVEPPDSPSDSPEDPGLALPLPVKTEPPDSPDQDKPAHLKRANKSKTSRSKSVGEADTPANHSNLTTENGPISSGTTSLTTATKHRSNKPKIPVFHPSVGETDTPANRLNPAAECAPLSTSLTTKHRSNKPKIPMLSPSVGGADTRLNLTTESGPVSSGPTSLNASNHRNNKPKIPLFSPKTNKDSDPAKKNFLSKGSKARTNSHNRKLSSKYRPNDLLFEKSPVSESVIGDDISTKKVKFKDKFRHDSRSMNPECIKAGKFKGSLDGAAPENSTPNKKGSSNVGDGKLKQPKAKDRKGSKNKMVSGDSQKEASMPDIAAMINLKVLRGLKNVNLSKLGREVVLVKKLTEKDIENINVNGLVPPLPHCSDIPAITGGRASITNPAVKGQAKSKKSSCKKGSKSANKRSKSSDSVKIKNQVSDTKLLFEDRIPMSLERFKRILGSHRSARNSSVLTERKEKELNFSTSKSRHDRRISGDLFPFLKDDDYTDFKSIKTLRGPVLTKTPNSLRISQKLNSAGVLPKPSRIKNMGYSIGTNKISLLPCKEREKTVKSTSENLMLDQNKELKTRLSLCDCKVTADHKVLDCGTKVVVDDKCEKVLLNGLDSCSQEQASNLPTLQGVSNNLSLPSSVTKSVSFGGKNIEISDGTISNVMKTIMSLRSFVRLTDCNWFITQYCPEMHASGKKDSCKGGSSDATSSQSSETGDPSKQKSAKSGRGQDGRQKQGCQPSSKVKIGDPKSEPAHSASTNSSALSSSTGISSSEAAENLQANAPYAIKSRPRSDLPSTSTSNETGFKSPLPYAVKSKPFKSKLNPLPVSLAAKGDSPQSKGPLKSKPSIAPALSSSEASARSSLLFAVKGRSLSRKDRCLSKNETLQGNASKQKSKAPNHPSCNTEGGSLKITSIKKLSNLNPRVVLNLDSVGLLKSGASAPCPNPDAPKHVPEVVRSNNAAQGSDRIPAKSSKSKDGVPSDSNTKPDSINNIKGSANKEKLNSKSKIPVSCDYNIAESSVGNDLYDVVKRRTASKNNLNKPNPTSVAKMSNPKAILENSSTASKMAAGKGKRSKSEVASVGKGTNGEKTAKKSHCEESHSTSTSVAINDVPSPVKSGIPKIGHAVPASKQLFCIGQSDPDPSPKSSSRTTKGKKAPKAKSDSRSGANSSTKTGGKAKKPNAKGSKNSKALSSKLSLKLNKKDIAVREKAPVTDTAWKIDSNLRRNDANAYQYCDPTPGVQSKTNSRRSTRKSTSLPGNITIKSEPIDDYEVPDHGSKLKDALSCFDFDETSCVDNLSYSPYSSRRVGRSVECPPLKADDADDFKEDRGRRGKGSLKQRRTSKKSPEMNPGAVSSLFSNSSEPKSKNQTSRRRGSKTRNSDCKVDVFRNNAVSSRPSRRCKGKAELIDLVPLEEKSVTPIITIRMDSKGNNCIVPNRMHSLDEKPLDPRPADTPEVLAADGDSECDLDDKPELKMKLKLKTIMTRNNEPKIVVVGKEFKVVDSDDSDVQEIPWVPEEFPSKKKKKDRSLGGRSHHRRRSRSDANPEFQCPILITNIKKEVVDEGYVEDKTYVTPLRLSLTPIKQSSEVEEMKCEPLKLYRRSNNFYLDNGTYKRKLEDVDDPPVPDTSKRRRGRPASVGKFASPQKDLSPLKNATSFDSADVSSSSTSAVPIPKKPPAECTSRFAENPFGATGMAKRRTSARTRTPEPDLNIVIKQEPISEPEEDYLTNDAEKMTRRRRSSLKCDNYKKYFDSDSGGSGLSSDEIAPACIRPKPVKKKPVKNPEGEESAANPKPAEPKPAEPKPAEPKPVEPEKVTGRRSRVSDFKKYFDSENGNSSDSDDCKLVYAKLTPKTRRAARGRRRRKYSAKPKRDPQAEKAIAASCNPCTVSLKRLSSVEVEKHASAPLVENVRVENKAQDQAVSGGDGKAEIESTPEINPGMVATEMPEKNAMDKESTSCPVPSLSGAKLTSDPDLAVLKDATFYDKEEYLFDAFHRRLIRDKKNDPASIPSPAVASLAKVMAGPNPAVLKKISPYGVDAFTESLHEKVMKENKINCFPFDSPSLVSEVNPTNALRRPSLETERQVFEMPHLNAMKENTMNCEPAQPPVQSPGTSTPRIPELSPGSKVFALGNFPADCCSPQTKTIEKDISQGSLLFESGNSSKRDCMNYPNELHVQPRGDGYSKEDMSASHFSNSSNSPRDRRQQAMEQDKYNISPFAEFSSESDAYKRRDQLISSHFYRTEGSYESRSSQPVVDAPFGHASNSMHDNLRTLNKSFDAASHGSPSTSYYSSEYSSPPETRLPFRTKTPPEPDGFYNPFNRWDTGFPSGNNYRGDVKPFGSPMSPYNHNAPFAPRGEIYNGTRREEAAASYFSTSNRDQTSKSNQFPMDHNEFNPFGSDSSVKSENEIFGSRKDSLNPFPSFSSSAAKLRGPQMQKQDRDDCPFDKKMFFREHGYSPGGQYLMQGTSPYSPSTQQGKLPFKRETKMVSRELDFSSESNDTMPKYNHHPPPSSSFPREPMAFNPSGDLGEGPSGRHFPTVGSNEFCSIVSESDDSVSEFNPRTEASTSEPRYGVPKRSRDSSPKADEFSLESVKCEPSFDTLSHDMKMTDVGDSFMMDCDVFSDSPKSKAGESGPASANSAPGNSSSSVAKESSGTASGSKDMFSSDCEENYPDVRILDFQECLLESDSEMHPLLGDFELDFLTNDATNVDTSAPPVPTSEPYQPEQEAKVETPSYSSRVHETSQMFVESVTSSDALCTRTISSTTSSEPSLINSFTPIISMSNNTLKGENLFLTTFSNNFNSSVTNCQLPTVVVEKPLAIPQTNFFYNNAPIIISAEASSSQRSINLFPNTNQVLSDCLTSSTAQASPEESSLRPPFNGQEDILSMIVKSCDIGEEFDENLDSPVGSDEAAAEMNQKNLSGLSAMGMRSPAPIPFQAKPESGDLNCAQSQQPDTIHAEKDRVMSRTKSLAVTDPQSSMKTSTDVKSTENQPASRRQDADNCSDEPSSSVFPYSENEPSQSKSPQDAEDIDDSDLFNSMVHSFYGEESIRTVFRNAENHRVSSTKSLTFTDPPSSAKTSTYVKSAENLDVSSGMPSSSLQDADNRSDGGSPSVFPCSQNEQSQSKSPQDAEDIDDSDPFNSMVHSFYGEDTMYGLHPSVNCSTVSFLSDSQPNTSSRDTPKITERTLSKSGQTDSQTAIPSSQNNVRSASIEVPGRSDGHISEKANNEFILKRHPGLNSEMSDRIRRASMEVIYRLLVSPPKSGLTNWADPPTRRVRDDFDDSSDDEPQDDNDRDKSEKERNRTSDSSPDKSDGSMSNSQGQGPSVNTLHNSVCESLPGLFSTQNPAVTNLESTPSTNRVKNNFLSMELGVSPINKQNLLTSGTAKKRRLSFGPPVLQKRSSEGCEPAVSFPVQNGWLANQTMDSRPNTSCSEIEGPTLENSAGFKVNIDDTNADAQVKNEVQHFTLMSLELHVNTRDNLCPDPAFDAVNAIFYSIYDHSAVYEQEAVGVIALEDSSSPRGPSLENCLLSVPAARNHRVHRVETESLLFEKLECIVREWDPDILLGYEIQMASWGYLIQRAGSLNMSLTSKLSRVRDRREVPAKKMEEDHTVTDQTASLDQMNIPGRIILNVWRLMRKEVTLNIYTFENVYFHVLHRRTPLYPFRDLTRLYRGSGRDAVVRYYVTRVIGSVSLLEKLDLIRRTSEMACLFGIQFYDVLSRGSQFRVESMMLRAAAPMQYVPVSPTVQQRSHSRAPECVPLILEPESKFYKDPVVVLDFQSLYPSMIIAYNYCFSTCLGRVEHLGAVAPFEFGCTSLSVPPALIRGLAGGDHIHISPQGVAFVKPSVRRGVLPLMLDEILNTRVMVKQSMKKLKGNGVLKKLLDARQMALKLISNVTYGYTAASFSGRMPNVEVADSIVGKARETLERAIRLIEGSPQWKAKVVYGDTDSVFILLEGRTKEEAFRIGQEIADAVTEINPRPVKLKFEKVYLPCFLQTKKRYVGFMYETIDQKKPVFDAKGIETVRRDSCPAAAKVLEKSLKTYFRTYDISLVQKYVQKQFQRLLSGRVNVMDCIFAKEYRGISGYRPSACVPALEIAKRRLEKDPRSEPRVGERVPYVVVYGFPGLPVIRLVHEPADLLKDPSLRVNAIYYITRVISPPLQRMFGLVNVNIMTWYTNVARTAKLNLPMMNEANQPKETITQYFVSRNCPSCETPTSSSVCDACRNDLQGTTVVLNDKIREWERKVEKVTNVCISCAKAKPCADKCNSTDCPILFKLSLAKKDLSQASYLRKVLGEELF